MAHRLHNNGSHCDSETHKQIFYFIKVTLLDKLIGEIMYTVIMVYYLSNSLTE